MTVPRVAVLGCGYWGKNLVRNFAQLGALACICDANETALKAQEALYPQARLRTRFEDVLDDDEIDGVVIATPAALHYRQAREAIRRRKAVFVEKPLALHYHEGVELVEMAGASGVTLMVGHILEYHPAVTMLKDLVRRGELGQLRYIYSNRLNLGKVRTEENILWSFAPHDISVICSLVGAEPISLNTTGGNYLQDGIADVTVSNLLFESGVRAHIFVSWLHPSKEQKLVVIGDRKMAVFEDSAKEGKLKVHDKGIEFKGGMPTPRQTSETTLFFDEKEPLRLECDEFLNCIRHKRRPLTDGVNALRVLKVLEASQQSLERGGSPVPLSQLEVGVHV